MPHPHTIPAVADSRGRHDIYRFIHKALRKAQCEMLIRLGNTDYAGAGVPALVADLRSLMALGAAHISHEEAHVHTALDQRAPGATETAMHQHGSHRQSFRLIESIVDRLESAQAERRPAIGRELYLTYSAFIAHDFEHMFEEETAVNGQLWMHFDDAALRAIEGAIVASLPPERVVATMRLMIPAISRGERLELLGFIKAGAPKPAFDAIIEMAARPILTPDDFAHLAHGLGLLETAH